MLSYKPKPEPINSPPLFAPDHPPRSTPSSDYSIDADTDDYAVLYFYASCMTLIYVVGTPLLYAVLLYRSQQELSIHDPFTLDPAMPALLARIDADHPDDDPQVWVPLGGQASITAGNAT